MSEYEKLGIEIDIVKGGDLEARLNKIAETLNKAFKVEGLDALSKKLEGAGKAAHQMGQLSKAQLEGLAQMLGTTTKEAEKLFQTFKDSSAIQGAVTGIKNLAGATAELDAKSKLTVASQLNLGNQIVAINKRTLQSEMDKGNATIAALRNTDTYYTQLGNKILAINKRIEDSNKATRATALQQISANSLNQQINWNTQAGTQGVKYQAAPNGGFVRASVNTNALPGTNDFSRLNAEAIKLNNSMKNIGQTTSWLTQSFNHMFTRLVEFYSIRKMLFLVSGEFQTAYHNLLDFNQELHNTAAISNASQSQMNKLSDAALAIATNSKFSAAEVMKSMKTIAQAGVSASDLPAVARTVDFFATGTGSTPEQAAKVLTTAMNVWNVTAEKSGKISNLLTAALNASKLEVGELSTAFNYMANQSAIFGKSMEETTSIIAVLANQGIQASTIGTSMSQLFTKLAAPSPRFRALLKEFQIGLEEISPRAHTFAEIVARFEKAGIPAERIMGALEARVGRALVTAIQAGSDKFQLMTDRITNSNAAAVAYNESMKGVLAQMNILRGEIVTTLNSWASASGASFTTIRENLQDFIVGLRSTEGQIVVFSTAVLAAFAAISAAVYANPIFAGISLIVGGVLWGISKVGEANRELAKDIDKHTKASAEQSAVYQRKSDALYSLLSLVDKNKVSEDGYLIIQENNKKKLREIMNLYPEMFKGLDTKKLKYEQLTDAIKLMNKERDKEISADIYSFNKDANRITAIKQEIAKIDEAQKAGTQQNVMGGGISGAERTRLNRLKSELKLAEDAHEKNSAANIASGKDVTVFVDEYGTKRAVRGFDKDPENKPGEAVIVPESDKAAKAAAEKQAKNEESWQYWLAQQRHKLAAEVVKAEKAEDEEYIKNKKADQEDKRQALQRIFEDNRKIYAEETDKDINELNKVFAEKHGMLWDAENKLYRDPKNLQSDGRGKVISTNSDLWRNIPASDISERDKFASERRQANDKLANEANEKAAREALKSSFSNTAPHYTSYLVEKDADKILKNQRAMLILEKERAWTGNDILNIEKKEINYTLDAYNMKKVAYEQDIAKAEEYMEKTNLTSEELDTQITKYEDIKGKLASVNDLIEEQKKKQQQVNGTLGDYFTKGVSTSTTKLGSYQSLTESLGESVTTTAIDGVTTSLDNMVTALKNGENAWSSFKTGISSIISDIAKTLQTYIVKMLVVYAVQKLVGLASTSYDGTSVPNGVSLNQTGADAFNTGNVNWSGGSFAAGGLLKGGTPGKDSIPILAMQDEYVLKADAVRYYGVDYINALNDKRIQKFAEGGSLGGSATNSGTAGNASAGFSGNLQIINLVDPNSLPPATTDTQIINVINLDIAKKGPTYKNVKMVAAGQA